MCFFGDFNVTTPKRRSSPHTYTLTHHTHTHSLTNTLTLTHTHDWPTVASSQVVPEEFFQVLQFIF